jgi:hypothetical protein
MADQAIEDNALNSTTRGQEGLKDIIKAPRGCNRRDKRKNAFQTILSGIKKHKGERMRFLTLTSKEPNQEMYEHWQAFVKRIRRVYGTFEFFAAWTSEGNGVIHVLFFGSYMERDTLSEWWSELHAGSWDVDIRSTLHDIDGESVKRLAGYCVAQYVGSQSMLIRSSYSKGWVYRGFKKDWRAICKHYDYDIPAAIDAWDRWLDNDDMRRVEKSKQETFAGDKLRQGVVKIQKRKAALAEWSSLKACMVDLRTAGGD